MKNGSASCNEGNRKIVRGSTSTPAIIREESRGYSMEANNQRPWRLSAGGHVPWAKNTVPPIPGSMSAGTVNPPSHERNSTIIHRRKCRIGLPIYELTPGDATNRVGNPNVVAYIDTAFVAIRMPFPRIYVQRLFDSIAPRYDVLNRFLSLRLDIWWRKQLVRSIPPADAGRALDVATGTGDVLLALQNLNPVFSVGVDLSAAMLTRARAKVAGNGTALVQAAAEHLPFPDESFDLVTIAFGVRNFSDLRHGLHECRRVLRPRGLIRILEFSRPRGIIWKRVFGVYFRVVVPTVGRWVSGHQEAYTYLPNTVSDFPDGEAFTGLLADAGFHNVTYETMTRGVVTLYSGSVSP